MIPPRINGNSITLRRPLGRNDGSCAALPARVRRPQLVWSDASDGSEFLQYVLELVKKNRKTTLQFYIGILGTVGLRGPRFDCGSEVSFATSGCSFRKQRRKISCMVMAFKAPRLQNVNTCRLAICADTRTSIAHVEQKRKGEYLEGHGDLVNRFIIYNPYKPYNNPNYPHYKPTY